MSKYIRAPVFKGIQSALAANQSSTRTLRTLLMGKISVRNCLFLWACGLHSGLSSCTQQGTARSALTAHVEYPEAIQAFNCSGSLFKALFEDLICMQPCVQQLPAQTVQTIGAPCAPSPCAHWCATQSKRVIHPRMLCEA